MGTKYLIDTNAIIEFLGGLLPDPGSHLLQEIVDQNNQHFSIINKIEILGFNGPSEEMDVLEEFVSSSTILPLSDSVAEKTIELRRLRKIKLPDAIIAATALVHDLTVITRNTSDFDKIEGLEIINPHDIN